MSSLEEENLKRYAQEPEESPEEPGEDEVELGGVAPGSLEDEVLDGYSQQADEPSEEATHEGSEAVEPGSPEEEILDRNAGGDRVEEASDAGDGEADEPPVVEEPAILEGQAAVAEPSPQRATLPSSPDEVVETLRRLREDVGQISELSSEEGSIVRAFSLAFLKLMEPLAKALPVDVSVLPLNLGPVERANVVPKGDLVILFTDGRMESIDLSVAENRDLLVAVMSDAMPRFNRLISQRRSKIEKRINFLSSVTRELQNIAESFPDTGQ